MQVYVLKVNTNPLFWNGIVEEDRNRVTRAANIIWMSMPQFLDKVFSLRSSELHAQFLVDFAKDLIHFNRDGFPCRHNIDNWAEDE